MDMCATQIQSAWKGSRYRKNELPSLMLVRRAEERIRAFVRAWKMRKVMQTREIFVMSQHIKDLNTVAEYFAYIEKAENPMLLEQLKKDRRKAVQGFSDTIENLHKTGDWVKSYIGNKIVENEEESTEDGGSLKTPIRDFQINSDKQTELKELIATERFLSKEDISNNPYLFESDEFVKQKWLERKQAEYSNININNEEFVNQSKLLQSSSQKNHLKRVDNDDESDQEIKTHHVKRASSKMGGVRY